MRVSTYFLTKTVLDHKKIANENANEQGNEIFKTQKYIEIDNLGFLEVHCHKKYLLMKYLIM